MPKTDEKLADILAEMRKAVVPMICGRPKIEAVSIGDVLQWADRIEAAAERERAALDAARKVAKDTAEQYRKLYEKKKEADNQLAELEERYPIVLEQSNAAAMREALERCNEFFRCDDDNKLRLCTLARKADEATQAALAAPARNCDRYATAKDALDAFIREKEIKSADVDNMNLRDFFDWLFAPANGGAKCVNGLRGEPDCRGCNEHCEDVRKRNCFYWNPDIEGGVCSLTGKKSCPISCDNFHIPEKVSPPPAEGGKE